MSKTNTLKILCPFCGKPYDAEMITKFDYSMGSEDTGIYGEEASVKIFCSNCKKLVYQKNEDGFEINDKKMEVSNENINLNN